MHNGKSFDVDKLWVVAVISNPVRYKSRYELFQKFKTGIERAGANLLVVELAYGDRPFEITDSECKHHVQLRTNDELWHKENLINIGISRLPADCEYIAWIDADIEFIRHDWAQEIVHQLQHYQIIQCFQNAIDLGPNGEVVKVFDGFVYSWATGQPKAYSKGSYPHWHPGFAWAARREAIDALGGLMEFPVLGAADHHMAFCMISEVIEHTPKKISESYKKHLKIWQDRCDKRIKQNIGYMNGTIVHHWHGKKKNRKYAERWQILFNHNYDPELDIKKISNGTLAFTDQGERLRNDIRSYFKVRNEDSIDL